MNTDTIRNDATPQTSQSESPRHFILFKLQIPLLIAAGPGLDFFREMLSQSMVRALNDKRILCKRAPGVANAFGTEYAASVVSQFGPSIGLFEVTDLSVGLDAIRDEFTSLHALEYVEIGWLDFREGVWRGWHPKESTEPFQKNVDLIEQWAAQLNRRPPP